MYAERLHEIYNEPFNFVLRDLYEQIDSAYCGFR